MADPKLAALKRLANQEISNNIQDKLKPENKAPVASTMDRISDLMDRPAAMARAGIGALQDDKDVLEAIKNQALESSSKAPTGFDIASKLGDKMDVQNPYALAGLATLVDVGVDPTMLIPGRGQAKGIQMAAKEAKAVKNIPGMVKSTDEVMELLKAAEKTPSGPFGKVTIIPEKSPIQMKAHMTTEPKPVDPRKVLSEEEFRKLAEMFPQMSKKK